ETAVFQVLGPFERCRETNKIANEAIPAPKHDPAASNRMTTSPPITSNPGLLATLMSGANPLHNTKREIKIQIGTTFGRVLIKPAFVNYGPSAAYYLARPDRPVTACFASPTCQWLATRNRFRETPPLPASKIDEIALGAASRGLQEPDDGP